MRPSELACVTIGACLVSHLLWCAHRRKFRSLQLARPTVHEVEVERFVTQELERIRAGLARSS